VKIQTLQSREGIIEERGLGRYEESIRSYDKALVVDPKDAIPMFSKGTAFAKLGSYEEAIKLLDKALKIDPDNLISLNFKAKLKPVSYNFLRL
jgi:tetratricopeptide (TPR) repeat protein